MYCYIRTFEINLYFDMIFISNLSSIVPRSKILVFIISLFYFILFYYISFIAFFCSFHNNGIFWTKPPATSRAGHELASIRYNTTLMDVLIAKRKVRKMTSVGRQVWRGKQRGGRMHEKRDERKKERTGRNCKGNARERNSSITKRREVGEGKEG